MQRKLVRQGAATMMISLPSKWIQKNNLDKGATIDLTEENNNLIISSSIKEDSLKKIKIDVTGLSPLVNIAINSLFIAGNDEIEIHFRNKEEVKDIQKRVIPELLGFEIIKQTSNYFVLKDVTGCEKQEIDELIKRIFTILDSMIEELVIALEEGKYPDSVIEADISINRLTRFCLRVLNKKGYNISSRANQIYSIVNILENIGDICKNMALESKKEKINSSQISALRESKDLIFTFKELIFEFDKEKTVKNAHLYENIKKKIKGKGQFDSFLLQLINSAISINNYMLTYSLIEVNP